MYKHKGLNSNFMFISKLPALAPAALAALCLASGSALAKEPVEAELDPDDALVALGKQVFFDRSLSTPGNKMGCVSCHEPRDGWTNPDSDINAGQVGIPGAAPHANGHIKAPAVSYAAFVPTFFGGCPDGLPGVCGGLFFDGRAEGWGAKYPDQLGPLGDGLVSETVTVSDLPDALQDQFKIYLGPLVDQALNPTQKGIEQNAGEKKVCQQVKTAKYKDLYEKAFGEEIDCKITPEDNPAVHRSFKLITLAIAAYEASHEVSPFNSKRDQALYQELACKDDKEYEGPDGQVYQPDDCNVGDWPEGKTEWGKFPLVGLTDEENLGHDLFYSLPTAPLPPPGIPVPPSTNSCSSCHSEHPPAVFGPPRLIVDDGTEPRQLYTEHAYHNIGIPYNRGIPTAAYQEVVGLSDHTTLTPVGEAGGFFKNPTLRNVGLKEDENFVKPFGHNGYFKTLYQIVHFYNTRDVLQSCGDEDKIPEIEHPTVEEAMANNCWPPSEFPDTKAIIIGNIGNMGLSVPDEEEAIVAYLKTLSDTVVAEAPVAP